MPSAQFPCCGAGCQVHPATTTSVSFATGRHRHAAAPTNLVPAIFASFEPSSAGASLSASVFVIPCSVGPVDMARSTSASFFVLAQHRNPMVGLLVLIERA